MLFSCRRFGTTHRSHLEESRNPKRRYLCSGILRVYSAIFLPTFRDKLSVPSWRVKKSQKKICVLGYYESIVLISCRRFGTTYRSHIQGYRNIRRNWISWPLKVVPIGCPKTSEKIASKHCVISQKSACLIYLAAEVCKTRVVEIYLRVGVTYCSQMFLGSWSTLKTKCVCPKVIFRLSQSQATAHSGLAARAAWLQPLENRFCQKGSSDPLPR